jgi:hypothetical protein
LQLWLLRIVWSLKKIRKTTWWIDPEIFAQSLHLCTKDMAISFHLQGFSIWTDIIVSSFWIFRSQLTTSRK